MASFHGFNVSVRAPPPPKRQKTACGKKTASSGIRTTILRSRGMPASRALDVPSTAVTILKGMYNVKKSTVPARRIRESKKTLTVMPATSASAPGPKPEPYTFYTETATWLRVPRFYGLATFGPPSTNLTAPGDPMRSDIKMDATPRPYQVKVIDALASIYQRSVFGGGAILHMDCGCGKTFCAIAVAVRHGVKTAILVNKGDLLDQWVERIKEFTNARVGIVRGPTIDIEDKDIVVFMSQSIWMGKYDADADRIFGSFGLQICDECHHWAAKSLAKTISRFPARCILGLSATLDRKDKLGYTLEWLFGKPCARVQREGNVSDENRLKVHVCELPHHRGAAKAIYMSNGRVILPKMITQLTEDRWRNTEIVRRVAMLRQEGRRIIVLSERRSHLMQLQRMLAEENLESGLYVGETTKKGKLAREKAKQMWIILATNRMANEGLDISALDTLLFASPQSDIRQAVGRIQRFHPAKKRPLVIDIWDTYLGGVVTGMFRKRKKLYESAGFELTSEKLLEEIHTHYK